MKKLLRKIEAEEKEKNASCYDDLSAELRGEIEENVPPEIVAQGLSGIKSFLDAF